MFRTFIPNPNGITSVVRVHHRRIAEMSLYSGGLSDLVENR